MIFSNKRVIYCNLKEMNEHLQFCKNYRTCYFREKISGESFNNNCYLVDRTRWLELSYRKGSFVATYKFDKATAETDDHQVITGLQAYRVLQRYYKVPRTTDCKENSLFSAIPLLWNNPKYERQKVNAICYDMNSAYAYAMLQDIPDTSVKPIAKKIEPGEIGFGFDEQGNVKLQHTGFCPYVFKLMESPFKRFVEKYYKIKQTAKTKLEKRKAKEYLNFCVGFLQGRNEFLRAYIVCSANERILNLIDENTIYCNTDSIVSLVERPELEIGTDIGQWKVEHKGEFAFIGFNFQWYGEQPSVRGVSKTYFKKDWDILKDDMPGVNNMYELDYFDFKLKGVQDVKSKESQIQI